MRKITVNQALSARSVIHHLCTQRELAVEEKVKLVKLASFIGQLPKDKGDEEIDLPCRLGFKNVIGLINAVELAILSPVLDIQL
jgi:hypothetical protein